MLDPLSPRETPNPTVVPTSWKGLCAAALTFLSPGILGGLICGALVGGVGGRLAMLVLRLTSSDSLHGTETDDEFIIGAVTASTVFLILLTALLGVAGGVVYLGVREWFPRRWLPLLYGLLGATFGGSTIIRPGGTDFTALEPLWLAVVMFVFLPAAYGVIVSVVVERLKQGKRLIGSRWRWAAVLPLLLMLVTGPIGAGILLVIGVVIAANRHGAVTRLWRSTLVTWLGRGAYAAVVVATGVALGRDVSRVL